MMRAILSLIWVLPLAANYEETAAAQGLANAKPGVRTVAERVIPVPTEGVSPQEQVVIAAPYLPIFNTHPKNAEEWKALIAQTNQTWLQQNADYRAKLSVNITQTKIAGVNVYIIEPLKISEKNKNRLLVHVHGGGYVFGPGEGGIGEAILMAGIGGYKIISVDYRMPPDYPYPAALD
ncbi:MAG: alpha/beta hydrolase, partial [Parachlamydiaceae bacterium]